MKNSKTLFQDFVKQIILEESRDEISDIAYLVFENIFGLNKTDVLAEKPIRVTETREQHLKEIVKRLNDREPVQYVVGEAAFYGRKFMINPSVLIPRPETEELVSEIIRFARAINAQREAIRILDIGTGSGCIPVTLALEIRGAEVSATDISESALKIAGENAGKLKARVSFISHNILKEEIPIRDLDIIVSNPPYVTQAEKHTLKSNVLHHEPHLALFVPDDDPLIFYNVIAQQAIRVLRPGGFLAVEINEKFGPAVSQLFLENGFHQVEIKKDINGKDRIVKATKLREI